MIDDAGNSGPRAATEPAGYGSGFFSCGRGHSFQWTGYKPIGCYLCSADDARNYALALAIRDVLMPEIRAAIAQSPRVGYNAPN